MSATGLNHSNARTEEQKKLMAQIEQDGVCPFCAEHFKKYHPQPILIETEHWFVTTNVSPYEGTKHHFLFVYKPSHIEDPKFMSPEATLDLFTLVSTVTTEHNIIGGSFFMRFGDTKYTGGSVAHLHAHLIVGGKQSEGGEAMRVKLGWKV